MQAHDPTLQVISDGQDHFLKLPFLVKGKLEYATDVNPPLIRQTFDEKASALGRPPESITYIKLEHAQVIREPIATLHNRQNGQAYFYQVMPKVEPVRMGYFDPAELADTLYNLSFEEILDFLKRLSKTISAGDELSQNVQRLAALSANIPKGFLSMAFASFEAVLNPQTAAQTVDCGLAFMGRTGREFLNGWVDIPLKPSPGAAMLSAAKIFHKIECADAGSSLKVRAMPTRQLHITAGNAPGIPFISAMRSFATKSAALIKMPYGVTLPGALLALGMVCTDANHPLTRNTSIVYWPGGDEETENLFYKPDFFDRIVVWGAPEAVTSVKQKSLFTKVLTFNPRYAMSFIGNEAFSEDLEAVAVKSSTDTMIWNQKACIASLVHYVEGTEAQALNYCQVLSEVMQHWDNAMPNHTPAVINGQIRRMRRGKLAGAKWFSNQKEGIFQSAVIYVAGEFDMADHPMWRQIIVRRVDDLNDCIKYLSASVSSVGIYPEKRREALRDRVAACGVSNIIPLGHSERMVAGAPHDGMMVFSELVDWKNA